MDLTTAVDLCARRRCFGCRSPGPWLCNGCSSRAAGPASADPIAAIDDVFIPWRYEGAPRDLVLALKLRSQRPAARAIAEAIASIVHGCGTGAEAITWVPARGRDIRRRGFDHAEMIARELARSLGLPARKMLARTSARPDQSTLTRAERQANLEGAFGADACDVSVLLVDDLVTTGATATSCARALRLAGSRRVDLAAACRAG